MISIVITIFNKEEVLEDSIKSVINQDTNDWELLLIDDGSTDNSALICETFLNDPRIRYFYKENGGVSSARNLGIKNALGNYICFLDADDVYNYNFVSSSLSLLNNEYDCVYADFITEDGHEYIKSIKSKKSNNVLLSYLGYNIKSHLNTWVIKKDIIDEFKIYFDESLNWGEDISFISNILMKTKKVGYNKSFVSIYRLDSADSITSSTLNKFEKDKIWINKLVDNIEDQYESDSPKYIDILLYYRLKGSLVYQLLTNVEKNKKITTDTKEIILSNRNLLKNGKIVNGLKGIKLEINRRRLVRIIKKEMEF